MHALRSREADSSRPTESQAPPNELATVADLGALIWSLWTDGVELDEAERPIRERLPDAAVVAHAYDNGDRTVRLDLPGMRLRDFRRTADGRISVSEPHRSAEWLTYPVRPGERPRMPRVERRRFERLLAKGQLHAMPRERRIELYEGAFRPRVSPRCCRPRGAGRPRSRRRRQPRCSRAGPRSSDGSDGEPPGATASSSGRAWP
jgi:hypothetical protein